MRIPAALGIVAMAALLGCGSLLGFSKEDPSPGPTGDAASDAGKPSDPDGGDLLSNDSGTDADAKAEPPEGDAGVDCEGFCTGMQKTCPGQYVADGCLIACRGWAPGGRGDTTGNTFWCRQAFLLMAVPDGPATAENCAAAGPSGGSHCN
jgi:hypothetical protein